MIIDMMNMLSAADLEWCIWNGALRIILCLPNARKNIMPVLITVVLLRTLTLTLKEPLWTKPKGG